MNAQIHARTLSLCVQAKQSADAWRSAVARAGGDKVLDDPKLLRRSLRKEVRMSVVCVCARVRSCV